MMIHHHYEKSPSSAVVSQVVIDFSNREKVSMYNDEAKSSFKG